MPTSHLGDLLAEVLSIRASAGKQHADEVKRSFKPTNAVN